MLLTPVVRPTTSQQATPSEATPFSYLSIKPWFHTEGNLLLYSSYLPLGVPNGPLLSEHQATFLAPLPGRRSTSARGVSHSQSFLLCYCFAYFILVFFLILKIQKNSCSFHCCYLFYHACYKWLISLKLDLIGNMGSRKNNTNIIRNTASQKGKHLWEQINR